MTSNNPAAPARLRVGHHRTETIRPFVQKYQYYQLPLPDPIPAVDEEADDFDFAAELAKLDSQE